MKTNKIIAVMVLVLVGCAALTAPAAYAGGGCGGGYSSGDKDGGHAGE